MDSAFRLRLPATSANLGAAFDSAAVALRLHLDVQAIVADRFSISASGRNADQCSRLDGNLLLDTYTNVLVREGRPPTPLAIRMHNEIPLGMGCGSSAAVRLAGIALASHFGELGWTSDRVLFEACKMEGHPDNAGACWLGGLVIACCEGEHVHVARVEPPPRWHAMVVIPSKPVATSHARAVLPPTYSRADTVANLQAASMLGLAFAQGRADLLRPAMQDRIHQPYRSALCPLLPLLLPLAGSHGIAAVALSGAGPSVLLILGDGDENEGEARAEGAKGAEDNSISRIDDPWLFMNASANAANAVRGALGQEQEVELLTCRFEALGGVGTPI